MFKNNHELDFTVITVCYNSASTIQETISSVLSQKEINFEYIIIDGVSTDGTIDILNANNDRRLKYISEPDKGLYDAMNKGIAKAKGKIVAILNSDDLYINDHVLSDIFDEFNRSNADLVSGNLYYFDNDFSQAIRKYPCENMNSKAKWKKGKQPPHPSTFVRRSVYEEIGYYHSEFKISSDYEFLLRAIFINNYKHSIINKYLVAMRMGGESTSGFKSRYIGSKEVYLSWKKNNISPPLFLIPLKIINKLLIK
ncbi:glycosyltransferase family 2 protein [Providencia rettgeri]|uniref:glycosyltransferase family 2 protein n=1 Tax=Providencia TaxID=586 RepID=UPI000BD5BB30|nr:MULTISPECIES: glycosyltransferase family 2 protein [Providencia]MBW3105957.1 glycosyltransferase [Providencia rettgeri]PCQ39024.1 glycosyl transferase [Providencia rettgeri]